MEYKVFKTKDLEALERKVYEFIQKGWKPQGGVATDPLPNVCFYLQAMIKEE
jgi:hypothetical protein